MHALGIQVGKGSLLLQAYRLVWREISKTCAKGNNNNRVMNSAMEEYRKDKTQPCFQGWGGQSRKGKRIEEDILMKMVLENLKKK